MRKIFYIGELPPPYGGVTVKNKLLYQNIFKEINVEFIDLMECKRNILKSPWIFVKLIYNMLKKSPVIIGVGSKKKRKLLLTMQKILGGKESLKKVMLIGMGGKIHVSDVNDSELESMLKEVGSIWLETNGMIEELEKRGFNNIHFFPNCRISSRACKPMSCLDGKLKLVFFSRICKEKGVDIIINAFEKFPSVCTLDFYGEIDPKYKETFENFINSYNNVEYKGVFDSTQNNVYEEINKYDVMLFPTKWMGEGVPGVLVEMKMAGVTAIVSDWNFNSEIVIDGVEGIVLQENTCEALLESVERLAYNRKYTMKLKQGSYDSRIKYDVDSYKDILRNYVFKYK